MPSTPPPLQPHRAAPGAGAAERAVVVLAFLYFFLVLASYYVLRPVRDEIGVAGGVDKLPWLFLATLGVTVAISPVFSTLVARLPRRRFVAWSYRTLIAFLVAFFLLLRTRDGAAAVWAGRCFFVWLSVFNLFVTSLFWAVMSDVFRTDQARRLYGVIGAGGTLGGLCGGLLTSAVARTIGPVALLLVAALLLELALQCMFALTRRVSAASGTQRQLDAAPVGGGALGGMLGVARSPYLLGIAAFMMMFTIGSTFLYFLQAQIVSAAITDRVARTLYFARVDIWVNALTLVAQMGLTRRLLVSLGVGRTLLLLPALSVAGFLWLGCAPVLTAVIAFQVVRRAGQFAVTTPSREVLFVPLSREQKYKAKNFVDTFVFRAGDQVGAWSHAGMMALGLGISGIAFAGVPLSLAWMMIALWLGRAYARLQQSEAQATGAGERCP
ncbi:MAG: MFS transporter [Proteobacteria bacterium]|nr:MFS transporter [Pseudomonadota bacterium]